MQNTNDKNTIQYRYWKSMLRRCYDEKYKQKHPTYKDCTVCEEWLNFQTFAKWFDENYYECEGQRMELDKDILKKDNKVYSQDTCVFVPQRINVLFTKRQNHRGKCPIGVYYESSTNKYRSQCNVLEEGVIKRKKLGRFTTQEDAFYKGYKPFKETYIKEVANDYKDIIPDNLYDAMMNYKVEIDD